MRILLRNKIPFFSHLTVSWFLPVTRIIFLKSSQIQSGGYTNLLCKSVNKVSFAEEAIGNIIKSSYKSTVGSVSHCR